MSLRESWLADRQQRQQEAAQRQQVVQTVLTEFNQTRQLTASQLASQLTLFRVGLSQQDEQRRVDFQVFAAELQQYCQQLQQETLESLSMTAADRELMAQQLALELQQFHQDLQTRVRSLRANQQIDLATLKAETEAFLAACQTQRLQVRAEVQESLAASRSQREAEVQALFTHLADFRAELRQFRQSLSHTVWGQSAPSEPAPAPRVTVPKLTTIPPTTTIAPVTKPAPASAVPAKTLPANRTSVPKSTPKAAAKPAPAAKKVNTTQVSVSRSPEPSSTPAELDTVPFEPEIYTFLQAHHGARLTQIESGLKVNRFQAVDALRSLIKKGLVTQRDRVYLTQPES